MPHLDTLGYPLMHLIKTLIYSIGHFKRLNYLRGGRITKIPPTSYNCAICNDLHDFTMAEECFIYYMKQIKDIMEQSFLFCINVTQPKSNFFSPVVGSLIFIFNRFIYKQLDVENVDTLICQTRKFYLLGVNKYLELAITRGENKI